MNRRKPMVINGMTIGQGRRPWVVAEMSGNHQQSLQRALAIVDAAADAGADALKIQTYTADSITLDCDRPEFMIDDPDGPWHGRSLYELYEEAGTPRDWHPAIFQRCRERGLVAFSSPFDVAAVDFLESLAVPCYKIASFEIVDIPLIRRVARTGKPVILSTGMATLEEITEAVTALRSVNSDLPVVLLKCTSAYPAPADAMNLNTIRHLRETFDVDVGLSDHTLGIAVPVAAVALGACVIEKHLTLSRAEGGPDATFSLEPPEFRRMVDAVQCAWQALGGLHYGAGEAERANRRFRKSVFAVQDIAAGERFTVENLRVIRPGNGLHPRHYEDLLGKTASCSIARGTPMTWDLVNPEPVTAY